MPDTGKESVVLLAEDDNELRRLLAAVLRRQGFRIEEVTDGFSLRDRLQCPPLPDFVVSDVRMPGLSGLEVFQLLRWKALPIPPFVVITGFGDEAAHELAAGLGAVATFDKPFDVDELRLLVGQHIQRGTP